MVDSGAKSDVLPKNGSLGGHVGRSYGLHWPVETADRSDAWIS